MSALWILMIGCPFMTSTNDKTNLLTLETICPLYIGGW